ncbi:DUF6183 family protein [Kitasatospora terrestris]|uniref:Uncharacterized protein n=1 Tax=Kitasatospora terrestris TaxID=258051 RepID=A0ABP9DAX0_9ACTN
MTDEIAEIAAGLPELKDVRELCGMLSRRVERGDLGFVGDLGVELAGMRRDPAAWQDRTVLDHVLRLLATTAGAESVAQVLRVVSRAVPGGPAPARHVAAMLAADQRPEDLAQAFTDAVPQELRACLLHELLLRGAAVTAWADSVPLPEHPLSVLPLTRLEIERRAVRPRGFANGSGVAAYGAWKLRPPNEAFAGPAVLDVTSEKVATAIGSAVAAWPEESNGQLEARVFAFADPLDPVLVPAALPTLGLACLAGAAESSGLVWNFRTPEEAWQVLFAAAYNGGAYGPGLGGAYGRLAAWQSAAALVGAAPDTGAERVEELARRCTWYGFAAGTDWFDQVAWDLGVAVLGPDGRRLAVLAATDTD